MKTAHQYESLLTPCQVSLAYKLVAPLVEGKSVLDIGCSTGEYLERFSKNSVGLDYSEPNLKICREKGLTVQKVDFNSTIPLAENSFEIVFCSHVLEHVDSPLHLLQKMHRVLIPKGKAIIAIPVEMSLARVLLRDPYFTGHRTHLYSFSLDGLTRLFESAGFEKENIILDYPLLRRINSTTLLSLGQFVPKKMGMLFAANIWLIATKN